MIGFKDPAAKGAMVNGTKAADINLYVSIRVAKASRVKNLASQTPNGSFHELTQDVGLGRDHSLAMFSILSRSVSTRSMYLFHE